MPPEERDRRPAVLFALAVAVRLALAVVMPPTAWNGEMLEAAKTLAATGRLADPFGEPTGPTAHLAPVYPALLAAEFRLFGSESPWPPRVTAALACGLVAALLPAVARRMGLGRRTGLLAGLLFALAPAFPVELQGTWEQPLVAVVLLLLLLAAADAHDHGWQRTRDAVRYGLVSGFALLLAPGLLFVVVLAPLPAVFTRDRRAVSRLLVAGLVTTGCLAPWVVRNAVVLGGFVPLRSNLGLELAVGNNDAADGTGSPVVPPRHPFMDRSERDRLREVGELAYMREKRHAATAWIADHPAAFARLTTRRVLLFWFPPGELCLQSRPALGWAVAALLWVVAGLSLVSLARLWLARDRHAWLWTVFLFGPALVYMVTHFLVRYREPVHAIGLLLALALKPGFWPRSRAS